MKPGARNLITDVPGLQVGNAEDERVKTGVTAILFDAPAIAAVDIRGGAPGTRDTELLAPEQTVESVDALVLSGGSAFGLDAMSGVQSHLARIGRGFAIGDVRVPIVPGAILFDLLNGGDKTWGDTPPYGDLGRRAAAAAGLDFALGSAGAGYGATTATLKGGLGSAATVLANGITVGALVAVNAVGNATMGDGPHFWAAPFEMAGEFGGLGWPDALTPDILRPRTKLGGEGDGPQNTNTTIAVVATDAALTKAQTKRLAVMAQDGLARALYPAHTPYDGDLVFAASTGKVPVSDAATLLITLGNAAAVTLARATARAVYEARPAPGDLLPCWRTAYGR